MRDRRPPLVETTPTRWLKVVSYVPAFIVCDVMCGILNASYGPIWEDLAVWFHFNICEPVLFWHLGYKKLAQ